MCRQLLAMDIPGETSAVDDARAYYAALHSEDRAHVEATQPLVRPIWRAALRHLGASDDAVAAYDAKLAGANFGLRLNYYPPMSAAARAASCSASTLADSSAPSSSSASRRRAPPRSAGVANCAVAPSARARMSFMAPCR